jgi:uncharacterized membrane protein YgaE (UPF0421/DUF939 family)
MLGFELDIFFIRLYSAWTGAFTGVLFFFLSSSFSWGLCVGVVFLVLIDVRMLHVDTLSFLLYLLVLSWIICDLFRKYEI